MQTPSLYQHELTLAGGLNPFGLPNFVLWWTGTPKQDAPMLPILDNPSWALLEWHPASDIGSPVTWPGQELGPYPSRGFYDVLQPFRRGGEPSKLDSAELNTYILRQMVRTVQRTRQHSLAERKRQMRDMEQRRQEEQQGRIADMLHDAVPAFGEAASYRANPGATTALGRRIAQIEANLSHSTSFSQRMGRGAVVSR